MVLADFQLWGLGDGGGVAGAGAGVVGGYHLEGAADGVACADFGGVGARVQVVDRVAVGTYIDCGAAAAAGGTGLGGEPSDLVAGHAVEPLSAGVPGDDLGAVGFVCGCVVDPYREDRHVGRHACGLDDGGIPRGAHESGASHGSGPYLVTSSFFQALDLCGQRTQREVGGGGFAVAVDDFPDVC